MANDLNIRIKINSDTKQLEITQDGFEKIRQKAYAASDPIERFTNRIAAMGHAAVAFVAIKEGIETVVLSGLRLNSEMEQMKLGIASLIAVNSSNVTALGHNVTAAEKFAMAQGKAAEAVDLLRKANLQTPATLAQVTEGYQAALAPALRLGLTAEQTVKYVTMMTMAAAAMGQPMEQIAQESRALLSGEIDMNAQVARNLQITNEQIKLHTKQGDLYEFLTQKLGDFTAGGDAMSASWEGISSNIVDSIETIKKKATENIFENLKADGIDLQKKLTENADEISSALSIGFTNAYLVADTAFTNIWLAGSIAFEGINSLLNSFTGVFNQSIDGMNNKYRELGFFDYLSLGIIVSIEGLRQLGDVGLSIITFLGKSMNSFAQITLSAFAGINTGLGKLADLTGGGGDQFYANAAFWNKQVNALKQDGLKIDQVQRDIIGDMASGLDRLGSSYNKLALLKNKPTTLANNDSLLPNSGNGKAGNGDKGKKGKSEAQIEAEKLAKLDRDLLDENINAGIKRFQEELAAKEKTNLEQIKSSEELFKELNTLSGNWYDNEIVSLSNRVAEFAASGAEIEEITAYYNNSIIALDKKRTDEQSELSKKRFEEENSGWLSFFSDFHKGMNEQLFDAMVGKWKTFGDWFKDFWSSLSTSVVRALSSQLSTSIIGGLKDLLLGSSSNGGIVNELKNYGGYAGIFGTVGTLTGTTMSANDYASVVEKYGSIAGMTVTPDGTTIDNTGKITSMGSGSDLASLLNTASSLKTAYTAITSGVSTMMATGTASIATGAYNLGLTSVGDFFAGGTTGLIGTESGFAAGSAGSYGATLVPIASAAILGGVGGYALGSLGDKLFGTDTKAGSYGAIGGSIGAVVGSVVPVIGTAVGAVVGSAIGSLIGGFQGKDWISGQGYLIDSANSSSIIGKRWAQTTASDWGDEDVTNYFAALTEKEKSTISQAILSFETMLVGIGSDVSIQLTKGLYSSLSDLVNKGVAKAFIDAATDADTALIYKEWKSYAKSLKVSVSEAISSAVSDYTTTTRSFETWNLERSGNSLEALKLKSQWASADTASLEKSLGISGVTIENYLDRYKTAIKESFDPETINNWKSLGEQLMNNTEAADAYTNALKEQAAVSAKLRPQDMMLSRVGDATSITGTSEGTVLKDMLSTFNKLIRAIETQTKINELAAGR